ncbi:LRRN4 C-terminal-like protein [Archocentrus centrarchus]|uniref:LRRN4 C-terminal-like protein n=1 Tax=Archocentrus centrarchus TaxID=63155 RepID=UPI0011E9E980|nr:LRRN4 C-terminal-like protein [Archocentrus centrarchus]
MTSLCRNLVGLLFFVLPPMHSHLFTNAASASPPITRPSIKRITDTALGDQDDDYSDNYDNDSTQPPSMVLSYTKIPQQSQFCQYNPCLEKQEPCSSLSAQTGCLCPGMSAVDERPHPPLIQALVPVSGESDRGKIEVQWCAPSSVVSQYRIVIEGRDGDAPVFGDSSRRGLVPTLEVGTKVCVVAVNDAGSSEPSEFSCKRYEAHESSDHTLLAWIIGGGAALLLLIVIAALICGKCQKFRKGKRDSTDGFLKGHMEGCDKDRCSSAAV